MKPELEVLAARIAEGAVSGQKSQGQIEFEILELLLYALTDALEASGVSSPPPRASGDASAMAPELFHPVSQVYFRAGLLACREYMARFVEAQDQAIANSIRANWWPSLGQDYGPPRKLAFQEATTGEYGTPEFRCLTAEDVSPTQEALPIALAFLERPFGC